MTKKRTLLDRIREWADSDGVSLDHAAATAQGLQATGATAGALSGGAMAVAGAVFSLAGVAVGLLVSSFQNRRMKDEFEFIAECIDQLPQQWAEDGTLAGR